MQHPWELSRKVMKMYIPKFIYELLPLLYVIIGVLGFTAPAEYGRFCGIVLIGVAVHIYRMRKAYRELIRDLNIGVDHDYR